MDFSLEWHQQELQRTARDLLKEGASLEALRAAEDSALGYSRELYQQMGELGWLQLGMPPGAGGTDDLVDVVVLYEELGRAALPGPHFVAGILAAQLIAEIGSAEQQTLLEPLASGTQVATLAVYEETSGDEAAAVQLVAELRNGSVELKGRKLFVPYALGADHVLVLARTGPGPDDLTFFIVPTQEAQVVPLSGMSNDKLFEVSFDGLSLPASAQLGHLNGGWAAWQAILPRARVIQAAELVGLADRAFELAVDYAKQRVAFGHPIGSFQAIQHKCAEMMSDRDAARFVLYQAACLMNAGQAHAPEVAMAKAFCAAAARRVTKEAHQIFGGLGFTLEHRLNYYYRRTKAIDLLLGDVDEQLEQVAQNMGL